MTIKTNTSRTHCQIKRTFNREETSISMQSRNAGQCENGSGIKTDVEVGDGGLNLVAGFLLSHKYPMTTDKETVGDAKEVMKVQETGQTEVNKREEREAPEGGWGWVVAFSAFVTMFVVTISIHSFGVLFSDFMLRLDTSFTVSTWIYNLGFVLSGLACCLVDPLATEFGYRTVALWCAVLHALGLVMSAFAPSATFLFFSFCLLTGLNVFPLEILAYMIIPHYFSRRLEVANAIMMTGGCLSQILVPPFYSYLQGEYGYRGATLILAGICFNCCAAAMTFHPVEWHSKKPQVPSANQSKTVERTSERTLSRITSSLSRVRKSFISNVLLLKSPSVLLTCIVQATVTATTYNLWTMIPFSMQGPMYSMNDIAVCMFAAGVANLLCRIGLGLAGHFYKFNKRISVTLGCLLCAVTTIVFSVVPGLEWKTGMLALFGVGYGTAMCLYNLMVVQELGLHLLLPVLSFSCFFSSMLFLVIGPLSGMVRDVSQSYVVSLCFLASILLLTVVMWLLLPVAHTYDLRCRDTVKQHQQQHQQLQHQKQQHENVSTYQQKENNRLLDQFRTTKCLMNYSSILTSTAETIALSIKHTIRELQSKELGVVQ